MHISLSIFLGLCSTIAANSSDRLLDETCLLQHSNRVAYRSAVIGQQLAKRQSSDAIVPPVQAQLHASSPGALDAPVPSEKCYKFQALINAYGLRKGHADGDGTVLYEKVAQVGARQAFHPLIEQKYFYRAMTLEQATRWIDLSLHPESYTNPIALTGQSWASYVEYCQPHLNENSANFSTVVLEVYAPHWLQQLESIGMTSGHLETQDMTWVTGPDRAFKTCNGFAPNATALEALKNLAVDHKWELTEQALSSGLRANLTSPSKVEAGILAGILFKKAIEAVKLVRVRCMDDGSEFASFNLSSATISGNTTASVTPLTSSKPGITTSLFRYVATSTTKEWYIVPAHRPPEAVSQRDAAANETARAIATFGAEVSDILQHCMDGSCPPGINSSGVNSSTQFRAFHRESPPTTRVPHANATAVTPPENTNVSVASPQSVEPEQTTTPLWEHDRLPGGRYGPFYGPGGKQG